MGTSFFRTKQKNKVICKGHQEHVVRKEAMIPGILFEGMTNNTKAKGGAVSTRLLLEHIAWQAVKISACFTPSQGNRMEFSSELA